MTFLPIEGEASRDGDLGTSPGCSCPSAPCAPGAVLFGVRTSAGRIAYVRPAVRVDDDFVARAKLKGRPEARYRFSAPCIEAGCPQWTGTGCGVLDQVIAEESPLSAGAATLPACTIRRTCRWYAQRGRDACTVCPLVVADTGGTETVKSMAPRGDLAIDVGASSPVGC
jgi:hypothetical protein